MSLSGLWDSLVDAICRPPRDVYSTSELPGGKRKRFRLKSELYSRQDMTLINKTGQRLACSHFRPEQSEQQKTMPIVIYCHCNSGSRRDAEEALCHLLPNGITVFALDFAGSGNSEGDWVTLGAHEVDDLEVAVQHLRKEFPEATIGLWGRSMGAVTALLYAAKDPSIAGIVVDSSFARLTELMVELVEEQKVPIPKPFMHLALRMMRRSVRKRAKFNIDLVCPLEQAPNCHIPVLFGHATEDTFVKMSHSERLHAAYGGVDKELETFAGDHNSMRPNKFYTSVIMFFHRALLCEDPETAAALEKFRAQEKGTVQAASSKRLPPWADSTDAASQDSEDVNASSQRQLSPPWDRNVTRTFTEKQLQAIRDNFQADLQIREQTKGVDKHDRKHALLAHRCVKGSSMASLTRLGLSDSETASERDGVSAMDLATAAEQAGDPWEAAQVIGESNSRKGSRNLDAAHLPSLSDRTPSAAPGKDDLVGTSVGERAIKPSTREQESQSPFSQRPLSVEEQMFGLPDEIQDAEEEEMLRRAMEMSLMEHHQTRPPATAQSSRGSLHEHIPKEWQDYDVEDAEEHMLAEALKQSLLDAEAQGLTDRTPALSFDLDPSSNASHIPQSPESARHRRRSRALFWRSRSDGSKVTKS